MPRVIIIDDDSDFGELTKRRLESAGFEVTFHCGPFGTLNAVRKEKFDVAVIDVAMPALGGPQLVGLIRETPGLQAMKLLLYSSMDPEPLQEIAGRLSVHAFLSKSAPKAELVSLIRGLLSVGS